MSTPTIAQKVDTQARVIRSLNLIHCADTQHMVGAVELERLLNLETANRELVQRMKDDGEYIYTLQERSQRYYEHILKHKEENALLTALISEQERTIKELEEVNEYLRQKNDKLEYGRTSK